MIMNTLKNLLDLVGLSKSDVFFIHSIIPLIKKNNNSMLLCNCKGPHYDHRKCRRYQIRTLNNNEGKSQCSILIGQKMSILLKLHYFQAKKKINRMAFSSDFSEKNTAPMLILCQKKSTL